MAGVELDLTLLDGVSFQCRPDCGLCCYTTPAVEPIERERLIQLDPKLPVVEGEGAWSYVASRGDGGACYLLSASRCRVHADRPFTCREFPISVHLGARAQATAVLSCPGLEVPSWVLEGGAPRSPQGLEAEISAVRGELERHPIASLLRRHQQEWERLSRRLARRGPLLSPEEIRAELLPEVVELAEADYPPAPPPPAEEGVEYLPLFHEPGAGLYAMAGVGDEVELLRVNEAGREPYSAGVWPDPRDPPALSPDGERALAAYLGHLLDREFTYWAAARGCAMDPEESLLGWVEDDIGQFGATVLARAERRRRLRGLPDRPLDAMLVWEGVRATDGEFLDRPTLGSVL